MMKLIVRLLLIALLLLFMDNQPVWCQDRLKIGIAPHTSARIILEMYQPLRNHLEKALQLPVDIITAPDFSTFAHSALAGQYDLAVTTGHQARLLQMEKGYQPLVTYSADFKAVALVQADGPIHTTRDLAGKSTLGLSPTSQVTLWGKYWLSDHKLTTLPMRYVSASDSVAQLLIAGEAAVGFTSLVNYQNLTPDIRKQLRILAQSNTMLGRVYMLNPARKKLREKISIALSSFAASQEGQYYFRTYKLEGYRTIRPRELQSMGRYAADVKKELERSRQQ
ncbi:MAG: phosphate/phosphite/phosphonate ABC transporter substrate-binding protein [Geobacter sp.]|jgi:phosphonate transport system substrate-binding protein